MTTPIPRTPIIDGSGRVAREWNAYFNGLGIDARDVDQRLASLELMIFQLATEQGIDPKKLNERLASLEVLTVMLSGDAFPRRKTMEG